MDSLSETIVWYWKYWGYQVWNTRLYPYGWFVYTKGMGIVIKFGAAILLLNRSTTQLEKIFGWLGVLIGALNILWFTVATAMIKKYISIGNAGKYITRLSNTMTQTAIALSVYIVYRYMMYDDVSARARDLALLYLVVGL